jgi:enoyl-CoA hydratase
MSETGMTTTAVEQVGAVAVVRMRAGRANALARPLLEAIVGAFQRVDASGARAVVIIGEANAFSAGLALPDLIALDRPAMTEAIGLFETAMRTVLACPLPTVAAINGHAIAGGCVLALMCDARIAAAGGSRIGLNEAQLGIGLPAIVVEPLRHRVSPSSLVRVALDGTLFSPDDAQRAGLVDEVVSPDRLEPRAVERAKELAKHPAAYAQIKRALLRPILETIDRASSHEREAWLDTWFSDDAQRTLRSAVDKIVNRS